MSVRSILCPRHSSSLLSLEAGMLGRYHFVLTKKQIVIKLRKNREFYSSQMKVLTQETGSQKLGKCLHWSGIKDAFSYIFETNYVPSWQVSIISIVQPTKCCGFFVFFKNYSCTDKPLVHETPCTLLWDEKEALIIELLQCWLLKKGASFFSHIDFILLLWGGLVNV